MANVCAPNLRGRCYSTHGKLTKTGDLKRSGNFSTVTLHSQSLQYRDYPVWIRTDKETGIEILVVGEKTPLAFLMGEQLASLAMNDQYFDYYRRAGVKKVISKEYEANMTLKKSKGSRLWLMDRWGTYREEIYTDGDFTYHFREY